jgi:hypothetical protein
MNRTERWQQVARDEYVTAPDPLAAFCCLEPEEMDAVRAFARMMVESDVDRATWRNALCDALGEIDLGPNKAIIGGTLTTSTVLDLTTAEITEVAYDVLAA